MLAKSRYQAVACLNPYNKEGYACHLIVVRYKCGKTGAKAAPVRRNLTE